MRLVAISLLLATAIAIEEPEPISEEERHDEVAQAQQRAKWLACLLLTRQIIIDGASSLKPTLENSKHDSEKTLNKIKADILYKCSSAITVKQAEQLLTTESIDLADPSLQDFIKIDDQAFNDPTKDINLTPEQVHLYEDIKFVRLTQEMNRTDDGFEQEPPIVEGFDPSIYSAGNELGVSDTVQQISLAVGGVVFLGLLFICWRRIRNPISKLQEKQQAKADKKKKKR